MNPFPQNPAPPVVTRDVSVIGLAYQIRPQIGATPVQPLDAAAAGQLVRGSSVARQLPWNPYSYPGVGREPGMFLPPDVPAIPAVSPRGGRKGQMGRPPTVSAGTPSSVAGVVSG